MILHDSFDKLRQLCDLLVLQCQQYGNSHNSTLTATVSQLSDEEKSGGGGNCSVQDIKYIFQGNVTV